MSNGHTNTETNENANANTNISFVQMPLSHTGKLQIMCRFSSKSSTLVCKQKLSSRNADKITNTKTNANTNIMKDTNTDVYLFKYRYP